MKRAASALAILAVSALCAASLRAGGDAEWNAGVKNLNNLKREINQNRGELSKAGVNVNDLQNKLNQAERQLYSLRQQMMNSNASFIQNSFKANAIIFSPLSPAGGKQRLVPVSPMVDMGMSNAFTGCSSLVPSSHLVDLSPMGSDFRPFRPPEEVLKDYTSQVKPAAPLSPFGAPAAANQSAMLPPPLTANVSGPAQGLKPPSGGGVFSSVGVVNPAAISGSPSSSAGLAAPPALGGSYGKGVVDPADLKSFDPPPPSSLTKALPPLPEPAAPPTTMETVSNSGQQFYNIMKEKAEVLKQAEYGLDVCVAGKAGGAGLKACIDPFNKTKSLEVSNGPVASSWTYSSKEGRMVESSAGVGWDVNVGGNVVGFGVSKTTDMSNNTGTRYTGVVGKGVEVLGTGASATLEPNVKISDR